MPTVDEAHWILPDVMIIIATLANIQNTSQDKPRYEKSHLRP
jgi:hypothetical protein